MSRKGDLVELQIESAAFEGVAVARHQDLVVFVRNAVPGDRVQARIVGRKRRHAHAVVESILDPSPHRIDARCRYFGSCGGCSWQNADYAYQLQFKRRQVEEIFSRIGGFVFPEVRPTLPSPESFFYRNKMEFSFGNRRWLTRREIESGEVLRRDFALGLHAPRHFDRILDLRECFLQSPESSKIVNHVREFALQAGLGGYDSRRHQGFFRNLVIRTAARTGQMLLYIVTAGKNPGVMKALAETLLEEFPEVTTIVNGVNQTRSPVAQGEVDLLLHGPGYIQEQLGGRTFRIGPTTFFQPNTLQAERIYAVVKDLAQLTGAETVFDLYCGGGGISLFLAGAARHIVGVDNHPASIEDARFNAQENGVENCSFHALDAVQALLDSFMVKNGRPDVLIVDPPRSGLHPDVPKAIIKSGPGRLIYISCHPATQARDLKELVGAYRIEAVQPADMFPQTYHIESIVLLIRRD